MPRRMSEMPARARWRARRASWKPGNGSALAGGSPAAGSWWTMWRDYRTRNLPPRRSQRRVVQVEAVEHLVVLVARRGRGAIGELLRVRPLKEEGGRVLGRELGVDARVVEGVVLVGQHLHRRPPGARRRIRLGVPDLAEHGGLPPRLEEDRDPSMAMGASGDRSAVRLHARAIGGSRSSS